MPDPDYLVRVARPAGTVREDSDHRYVELTAAQMARDEAAATVLAQVRCQTCKGVTGDPECPACAGVGIDPDVTFADLLPAARPEAGAIAARAVDAERARLRRILAGWHDRLTPPESPSDHDFAMALRVVIGEIDDDRADQDGQALTADDLHTLACWPDQEADLLEAGDHRDPNYEIARGDTARAARLRALAERARRHLGSPMFSDPAGTARTGKGERNEHG